jgi:hypothetical protein
MTSEDRKPDRPEKPLTLAELLAMIPKANWWDNVPPTGATLNNGLIFPRGIR